jgi:hypothetical protein
MQFPFRLFCVLFNMSQHLVRKLLKATSAEAQHVAAVQQAEIATRTSQRKRKQPSVKADLSVDEESIVAWHTKILLATDRAMASSSDSKRPKKSSSNAAAMVRLQRRREQKIQNIPAARATGKPIGAARTATSRQPQLVKIPTYNKKRHEKERQEKKQMKLANALERLHSMKQSKGRKPKTIFG